MYFKKILSHIDFRVLSFICGVFIFFYTLFAKLQLVILIFIFNCDFYVALSLFCDLFISVTNGFMISGFKHKLGSFGYFSIVSICIIAFIFQLLTALHICYVIDIVHFFPLDTSGFYEMLLVSEIILIPLEIYMIVDCIIIFYKNTIFHDYLISVNLFGSCNTISQINVFAKDKIKIAIEHDHNYDILSSFSIYFDMIEIKKGFVDLIGLNGKLILGPGRRLEVQFDQGTSIDASTLLKKKFLSKSFSACPLFTAGFSAPLMPVNYKSNKKMSGWNDKLKKLGLSIDTPIFFPSKKFRNHTLVQIRVRKSPDFAGSGILKIRDNHLIKIVPWYQRCNHL